MELFFCPLRRLSLCHFTVDDVCGFIAPAGLHGLFVKFCQSCATGMEASLRAAFACSRYMIGHLSSLRCWRLLSECRPHDVAGRSTGVGGGYHAKQVLRVRFQLLLCHAQRPSEGEQAKVPNDDTHGKIWVAWQVRGSMVSSAWAPSPSVIELNVRAGKRTRVR